MLTERTLAVKIGMANLLCSPLPARIISGLSRRHVPSRTGRIAARSEAVSDAVRAAIFWGIYESAERRLLQAWHVDADVLELGASLGVISRLVLERLPDGYRLICVEANPHLLSDLHRNLSTLPGEAAYVVENFAVHHEQGPVVKFRSDNSSLGSRAVVNGPADFAAPSTTLAALVAKHHLKDYLLVSDIEGGEEHFIFREDQHEALLRCRRMIIELHRTPTATVPEMCSRLNDLGFVEMARDGSVTVFDRHD